jgi:MraZ protein
MFSQIKAGMPLFTGKFDYSVDDKGRLSVPARLRDQLPPVGGAAASKETAETSVIITCLTGAEHLSVYTEEDFLRLLQSITVSGHERADEYVRSTSAEAETVFLDKQGRVQLSPELRRKAGITREVVVTGVFRRIEIWAADRWDQRQKTLEAAPKVRPKDFGVPPDLG